MREKTVRIDPDVPNWLLTKQGGRVLPVVTVVVLLAAAGAIAWAVADLVWWTRGGRRAVVRLPRDPRG